MKNNLPALAKSPALIHFNRIAGSILFGLWCLTPFSGSLLAQGQNDTAISPPLAGTYPDSIV